MIRIFLFLLSIFFSVCLCAENPSCVYCDGNEKYEIFITDTILPETYTRQFFVYKRNLTNGAKSLLFRRDSLCRINNPFVAELPMKRLHYPRIDTLEGVPYLFFFYEREPSNISVMNTEVVAVLLSLTDGHCYELSCKGRRKTLKLRVSNEPFERVFLCFGQSVNDSTKLNVVNYLKLQVENSGFVKQLSDVDVHSIKNYALSWNLNNDRKKMAERGMIIFPSYREPFAPLKARADNVCVLENDLYKVIAFPFGDILAYDKRKCFFFVVWAMEELQQEDYSSKLCWNGDFKQEIKMQGCYDTSEIIINLETGKMTVR